MHRLSAVIAEHSRLKDGVASLAYDPAIHDVQLQTQSVLVVRVEGHHGYPGQARA
jgi:hypothetical protein